MAGKSIIDLTDQEIKDALRSEHHRHVIPSYAFLTGELARRAAERNGFRSFVLAAVVGLATMVNAIVAVMDRISR